MLKPSSGRLLDRRRIPQRGILPVIDIGEYASDTFPEAHLRLPVKLARDSRDIGPRAIGLSGTLRYVHPFPAAEQFAKPIYRLRIACAKVPDPAGQAAFGRRQKRACYVRNVEKVPALGAIAHYGKRLAGDFLAQKYAEYGTVSSRSARPRAIGIEN